MIVLIPEGFEKFIEIAVIQAKKFLHSLYFVIDPSNRLS